jgi:hypothetical protein
MDDDSNAKKEDELTGEVLLPENDDEMPIEDDFDDDFLGPARCLQKNTKMVFTYPQYLLFAKKI